MQLLPCSTISGHNLIVSSLLKDFCCHHLGSLQEEGPSYTNPTGRIGLLKQMEGNKMHYRLVQLLSDDLRDSTPSLACSTHWSQRNYHLQQLILALDLDIHNKLLV